MAAVKITKFLGLAPKISSELLPNSAAQVASNVKLVSGDLQPYRTPVVAGAIGATGAVQTLHALRDPDTGDPVWLAWDADVDIAVASSSGDAAQRFYYTGDGAPKVSNYALATSGAAPYPSSSYDLGLPLPTTVLTTAAASFTPATTASFSRDAGNTATVVTGSAHGLRSGNVVTVRDLTADTTFNASNVVITVTTTTAFTYYNPGAAVSSTADTGGTVDLAGNTQVRSYVYTWYTPWLEESIASEPSGNLFLKEGQTVSVTDLPTATPSASNFVRGVRLYRTIPTVRGTEYFRLATLWFPTTLATVARASNVVTVSLAYPHNLIAGDRFKISGCTDTTFNITGGEVVSVVDDITFTFAQTAADVASKAETAGTLYHDVAETPDDTARYWGDGSYTFTDDFDYRNLTTVLASDDYDAPAASMVGIATAQNQILVGFFDNQLCFSEPALPHAWPIKYRKTFPADIVGVVPVGGTILVLTEGYPYQVSGSNPATMLPARIDVMAPCLAKKSIVNMGFGAAYATHAGLAVFSPAQGLNIVTKAVEDWDTWESALDPATIVAATYNNMYFGSHSTGSFLFEYDKETGGFFVDISETFDAAWTDQVNNNFYYVKDTTGDVYRWDDPDQPLLSMEWKSKTIVTKDYINLGAARVVADYTLTAEEVAIAAAWNAALPAYNAAIWAVNAQLGSFNAPLGISQAGGFNSMMFGGDNLTGVQMDAGDALAVVFKLWVDKALVFQRQLTTSAIFRLPTGYRSDTFEVGVSGPARVRAIHFGETPYGLRTA